LVWHPILKGHTLFGDANVFKIQKNASNWLTVPDKKCMILSNCHGNTQSPDIARWTGLFFAAIFEDENFD